MSDIRDEWVFAVGADKTLFNACRVVALILREYANRNGQTTVSERTIARAVNKDVRATRRYIKVLIERGYLVRDQRGGHTTRGGRTARAQFVIPGLAVQPAEQPLTPRKPRAISKDLRAESRASPRKHGPTDPLAVAKSLLTASGPHPYRDEDIMKRCGLNAQELGVLRKSLGL